MRAHLLSYIRRYRLGQVPLAAAVGTGLLVIATLTAIRQPAAQAGIVVARNTGIAGLLVHLVAMLVLYAGVPGWQLTGLWRAADRHWRERGTIFAARAAQSFATVSAILLAVQFAGATADSSVVARVAMDGLASGATLTMHAGGREIELRGALGDSVVDDLAQRLATAKPAIRRLRLNSATGSLHSARRLRDLIVEYRLNTHSTAGCVGACSIAYLAGRHRTLRRGAPLGLWLPPPDDTHLAAELAALRDAGLTGPFVRAWQHRGNRIWHPSADILAAGRIVHMFLVGN